MDNSSLSPDFSSLTEKEQRIANAFFGMMRPNDDLSILTFHMVNNRPTQECKDVLDKLVELGFLRIVKKFHPPAISYQPAVDFHPLNKKFAMEFFEPSYVSQPPIILTEKIV